MSTYVNSGNPNPIFSSKNSGKGPKLIESVEEKQDRRKKTAEEKAITLENRKKKTSNS